jgi:hypothetical protein
MDASRRRTGQVPDRTDAQAESASFDPFQGFRRTLMNFMEIAPFAAGVGEWRPDCGMDAPAGFPLGSPASPGRIGLGHAMGAAVFSALFRIRFA